MTQRVTISIAVHNLCDVTQRCVDSLFKHTTASLFNLVIIDNASTDLTKQYLAAVEKNKSNVRIVRNTKNLGFSAPHNQAFADAKTEFFLVLNNDVTVCAAWLDVMLAKFDADPKLVACGVKNACISLDERGLGGPSNSDPEYVEGSCLLVRSELIRGLDGGLFDPIYKFAYYEDSDLGLRIRKAGLHLAVVDLPILHTGAATSKTVRTVDLEGYRVRNQHVFLGRWGAYLEDRKKKPVTKDRIVVRRAGAQGDVILVTPILRALRLAYPQENIVVETACQDVLAGNPDASQVVGQLAIKPTDHVIDLNMAYEREPMRHLVEAYADVAGVKLPSPEDWKPRIYPTDTARIVAAQRMPAGSKYAVIHSGMIEGWVGRQWNWQRWKPVIEALHKRGYKTVLVGNESTPNPGTTLEFKNVHFSHFAAIMERASLFLGLDSMPFHVAQAFSIPGVVIFGSVDPALRIVPGAPIMPVVAGDVGCLGCHNWLPAPRTVTNSCVRNRELCMDGILPEQVIRTVEEVEMRFSSEV